MKIPDRYLRHFDPVFLSYGPKKPLTKVIVAWECKRCEKNIMPNTAGAQSHIAKHLREEEGTP